MYMYMTIHMVVYNRMKVWVYMITNTKCRVIRVNITIAFLALSAGVSVHTERSPTSVYLVLNFLEVILVA